MRTRFVILLILAIGASATVGAAVVASRVTVAATATVVFNNATGQPVPILVVNKCTADVYVGGSGVTTAAGVELDPEDALSLTLDPGEILYGIVASSTCRVDVLRVRQ